MPLILIRPFSKPGGGTATNTRVTRSLARRFRGGGNGLERVSETELIRPGRLNLSSLAVVGAEQLVGAGEEPLEPARVRHVQEVERDVDPIGRHQLEVPSEAQVEIVCRRQDELAVGLRRVREPQRRRERIRDEAAVRQRYGCRTELRIGAAMRVKIGPDQRPYCSV